MIRFFRFVVGFWAIFNTPYLLSDSAPAPFSAFTFGGYTSHKSGLVESNDTSSSLVYGIQIHGGDENQIGSEFLVDSTKVDFALNDTAMTTEWQEMAFRYNLGPLYAGIVVSNVNLTAQKAGTESGSLLQGFGKGFGAQLGCQIDFDRGSHIILDLRGVSFPDMKELNQKSLSLGTRIDVDVRGSVDLTRNFLDAMFGFRYRTYSATLDDVSGEETVATTYLGLRMNFAL